MSKLEKNTRNNCAVQIENSVLWNNKNSKKWNEEKKRKREIAKSLAGERAKKEKEQERSVIHLASLCVCVCL